MLFDRYVWKWASVPQLLGHFFSKMWAPSMFTFLFSLFVQTVDTITLHTFLSTLRADEHSSSFTYCSHQCCIPQTTKIARTLCWSAWVHWDAALHAAECSCSLSLPNTSNIKWKTNITDLKFKKIFTKGGLYGNEFYLTNCHRARNDSQREIFI